MIVDSSAVVAMLLNEPERDAFVEALISSTRSTISAGSWIELSAVLTRRGSPTPEALDVLMQRFGIILAPVTVTQAHIGRRAYQEYGRGTGHAADLNLGDCFAYALAKETGEPLLYKGDDFVHTDIAAAV